MEERLLGTLLLLPHMLRRNNYILYLISRQLSNNFMQRWESCAGILPLTIILQF